MPIGRACRFMRDHVFATRTLACAISVAGVSMAAQAAEISLDTAGQSVKDTMSNITTAGVTIYGTIDVGYGFNSHGVPPAGSFYDGAYWNIFGSRAANKSISYLVNDALEQSKLGVKVEESIYSGWTVIAKAEMGFDPMFGELADNCASLVRNNGKNIALQTQSTNGDGSRCGQAFSGPVYAGVSNATYGTVTFGRQQSLELDAIANYDAMQLSYAFSILGYSGTTAAGFGDTEASRWDNSVKYVYQYGPVHVAGMYSDGGPDTAIFDGAWGANAGFTWQGFSLDGVYTRQFGTVGASSLTFGTATSAAGVFNPGAGSGANGTCNPFTPGGPSATASGGNFCATNQLNGTVTDNEGWSVMAKYTFEFVDCCAGLKDQPATGPKLTLYAGIAESQLVNPRDPVRNGSTTIGGYYLTTVNNMPFATGSARDLNTEWAGARLDYPEGWAFAVAYYHFGQSSFDAFGTFRPNPATAVADSVLNCSAATTSNVSLKNSLVVGTTPTSRIPGFVGNAVGSNCGGDINEASLLVDYTFTKYFDVYGGFTYSQGNGGFLNGFLQDNIASVATGIRLKF